MLENFIMQVRRPKGVSSEREARASAAARTHKWTFPMDSPEKIDTEILFLS